ncbi:MAG: transposase [Flavipsychrobacter sp.]|jgi:REP element-mobilizing transposase RayT|nr:transposase [Flavipsychrobacter sp.]
MSAYHKYELDFFTATILQWKPLLADDRYKKIVMDSLKFLVENKRIYLCSFVIMNNHIHLIWHITHPHREQDVQRDFLRYTAQMMLKNMRAGKTDTIEQFRVDAKDRKYQIWERNALSVPLRTEAVVVQKLSYIHQNPVRAGMCSDMIEYHHSTARFYETGVDDFGFITHYKY